MTGKVVHIHLAKIVHDFCTCIVDSYATDIYYKDTSLHHMTADLQISILIQFKVIPISKKLYMYMLKRIQLQKIQHNKDDYGQIPGDCRMDIRAD